ncbi:MAG: response regulator [Bythopirellula sp.]|nr:response regulator [Bythopirellula sp.]
MTPAETLPLRIALAEDEPASRNILVRLLVALGHEVVYAVGDGAELIEVCVDEIDLVFVDLDMPVMDGLATAEFMSNRGIPVILISGHPDAQELVLEHEPVDACVRKPASLQTLRAAIAEALGSRR